MDSLNSQLTGDPSIQPDVCPKGEVTLVRDIRDMVTNRTQPEIKTTIDGHMLIRSDSTTRYLTWLESAMFKAFKYKPHDFK